MTNYGEIPPGQGSSYPANRFYAGEIAAAEQRPDDPQKASASEQHTPSAANGTKGEPSKIDPINQVGERKGHPSRRYSGQGNEKVQAFKGPTSDRGAKAAHGGESSSEGGTSKISRSGSDSKKGNSSSSSSSSSEESGESSTASRDPGNI
jgi:hypothetical protein